MKFGCIYQSAVVIMDIILYQKVELLRNW